MSVLLVLAALLAPVPDGRAFEVWFSARGVRVEIARALGQPGPPWLRGTGEIPAAAKKIADVVSDFRAYPKIFAPALKKATVLAAEGDTARLHLVWPYPFPLRNRDAVVSYHLTPLEGDGFVLSWSDDARPGDPREGVRIGRVAGETRIEPIGADRSRVTYAFLGDLGGKFPRAAEEKAWRAEPVEYFRALRRRLGIPDPAR